MADEEESKVCSHCNKEVAQSNFGLHELHCRRFLCVCPDCEESVPREELEQHRIDQHSQVRCGKCKKKVESCKLQDHEAEECEDRLKSCDYCQLELPWKSLAEHTEACGSRTERCGDCSRYIRLRDQEAHALLCSPTPAEGASPQKDKKSTAAHTRELCFNCMKSFPLYQLKGHQLVCNSSSFSFGGGGVHDEKDLEPNVDVASFFQSRSFLRNRGPTHDRDVEDVNEISTCPYCHLALPLFVLQKHEVKCRAVGNWKNTLVE
ncbi:XIAP-associated factor 1-like [Megalops cyprinoides]|uniref:XIAP-associated factor 1-like n=1 Tax=Megalops cyprinoides TaxID=118141 RepID=UPI00186413B7|nr:XIAP-associated factor 1-like [Megalops cyprinoides]